MTPQFKGGRFPGPVGIAPGTLGGRIPGPLQFEHVDVSKGTATKAGTKTYAMPAPASGSSTIIRARAVNWNLAKDSPLTEDVKQGELANCPVAAILAALAHTANGKRRINSMITEYTGASVNTTFSKDILKTLSSKTDDDPDYRAPDKELISKRYFSVALGSAVEVSDVFYLKYSERTDVDMVYMGSPKEALWPCVIEKAYASKVGSYEDLDDDSKHSINEFWGVLVGSKPQWLGINEKTDLNEISDAAKVATKIPTIGASRDDATRVLSHHGFAILGMQGSTIELFDPHGKRERLSLEEFRKNFKDIFFGNP
jgi:hypothetical protein